MEAIFDKTDTNPAVEDIFQVFLVDASDPTQTLLDNGKPGTAVFSLVGEQAEFQPGLVRFDGSRVQIDVTSLGDLTDAQLRFQLINSDSDELTKIIIGPVSSVVDVEASDVPKLSLASTPVVPGGALDLSILAVTAQIDVSIKNVRYDESTGDYTAEVIARNNGPAIGRQLAIVFPGLPNDVTFTNASGADGNGNPYINLSPAIGGGGLAANVFSQPVTIQLSNPNGSRFSLTPTVFTGGANSAPDFPSVGPLSVLPGGYLSVPLNAVNPFGISCFPVYSCRGEVPPLTF